MTAWGISYRVFGWLAIAIGVALTARLVAVIAATPSDSWLVEYEPVTQSNQPAATGGWPVRVADWIGDAAIARALIGTCVSQSAAPVAEIRERCMAAIDYGLAVTPASSELWLAKARLLSNQGILDEPFSEALRNSYATGAREGWIAAERLPFALRRREFLPDDLLDLIGGDVGLVLSSQSLAGPLTQAYIADPFLREQTWDVIERYATLDQQEDLLAWLQQAVNALR